ncbi:MAG: hypothetical protein CLLPBCKN_005546 [Chroococcidiopsis cubana SAG 39.79]|nr:hypothetical protein [Chroococcidiopsis cubana SAG 39.79]
MKNTGGSIWLKKLVKFKENVLRKTKILQIIYLQKLIKADKDKVNILSGRDCFNSKINFKSSI